jgi:hypothetical protein
MTAILKEDPPDLPDVERHIPLALARIVDRCLEKSPAARFQSTRDLAFALEGLSGKSGLEGQLPTFAFAVPEGKRFSENGANVALSPDASRFVYQGVDERGVSALYVRHDQAGRIHETLDRSAHRARLGGGAEAPRRKIAPKSPCGQIAPKSPLCPLCPLW